MIALLRPCDNVDDDSDDDNERERERERDVSYIANLLLNECCMCI
jgi:hypothetical protein